MTDPPVITRKMLADAFPGQTRLIDAMEQLVRYLTEAGETALSASNSSSSTAAASVILTSPSDGFGSGVVLTEGDGIDLTNADGLLTVKVDDTRAKVSGGHSATFLVTGPTAVVLPETGTLATVAQVNAGALTDGDKGDITVSSAGAVWTIDADVVTNAKLANMVQATFKGRAAGAGTGDPVDLSASQAKAILVTVGEALTKTDDTNVTLTLGGTPSTALLSAASLTLGWTGVLAVARGGTGGGTASGTLLDNITGFSGTGIIVRTGSGTYAFRTLTPVANETAITNGSGVSGNPIIGLASTIALSGKTLAGEAAFSGGSSITGGYSRVISLTAPFPALGLVSTQGGTGAGGFTYDRSVPQIAVFVGSTTTDFTAGTQIMNIYTTGIDVMGEVRCNSFRLDQTPTAGTFSPTHYVNFSANGTTYRIPCAV